MERKVETYNTDIEPFFEARSVVYWGPHLTFLRCVL